jgi:hypothetical protein
MSIQLTTRVDALEKRMDDLEEAFQTILSFVQFKFEQEELSTEAKPKKGKANGKDQ